MKARRGRSTCARLKAHISAKEYPLWLDGIRVQEIKPDGMLVVTFKDKLASDYARVKFSDKILKSAVEIWGEVSGLMIHQESDCLLIHNKDDDWKSDEKTLVKQAIQSLIGLVFRGRVEGGILNVGYRIKYKPLKIAIPHKQSLTIS
jgi:chromosomal replication initiation ATPase DnaA